MTAGFARPSILDTADTEENEKAFGRPGASRGASAFPKIRFVALLENGTHVLWAARMSKYASDEITLAQHVVPALRRGMPCLEDCRSHQTVKRMCRTSSHRYSR